MKLYKFYIIPEKDLVNKKYELYAFTNKNKYAERFISERDMSKFIKSIIEIDSDEYKDFANEHKNHLLDIYPFMTKDVSDTGNYTSRKVDVLSTYFEYMNCRDEHVMDGLFDYMFDRIPGLNIFKKNVLRCLKLLEYVPFYKLMCNNPSFNNSYDDYAAPDICIDEFAVFVRQYNQLFK